ncbi:MAG: helix-turn-helix domain-containing protein [Pseudomonadales bacterium]|nr:helix-turn-helix transcriptional regulator [Pseudomonadales bacterium]
MKLKTFEHFNCSLAQTLSVIGEHWTMLIIRDAFFGLRRFDQFQKSLGIARNVLSDRLKKLVQAGVLEKSAGPGHPEYRLTEKGLALQPVMIAMTHWGDTYMPHPDGDRLTFVDRQDGKPIQPVGIHAADGRRLAPKEIRARAGPGLRGAEFFARSAQADGAGNVEEGAPRSP